MDQRACEALGDQLYAFVDDALDIQATLQVQAHLESCAACFQRYQLLLNVRALLRAEATQLLPPAELEQRVRRLKRTAQGRRWQRWSRPRPLVLAAAAVLVLLAAVSLLHHRRADLAAALLAQHQAVLRQGNLLLRTADAQRVMAWSRQRFALPVSLPQASLAGFGLVGATPVALPAGEGVYVLFRRAHQHLAYVVLRAAPLPQGKRMRLGPHTLVLQQRGGYTLAFWQVAQRLHALIAALPEPEFLEYAALCLQLAPPEGPS
ncbi:MAG: hypothetical protein KatS3mg131_0445 [Candidatus Tectimicrobiota bacterium]|nr:MAG: hypothetical protein KatS3mg131_0445 [Candidatus Tectomicrobia bacterium]